jgi:hypothetical protein
MNDDLRVFLATAPNVDDTLRACGLYCLDLLDEREVRLDSVEYCGGKGFNLNLPLIQPLFGQYSIPMQFFLRSDEDGDEACVSCGPSTFVATNPQVEGYVEWLDKYMPRRGETLRDIIAAGNPDNLVLQKA